MRVRMGELETGTTLLAPARIGAISAGAGRSQQHGIRVHGRGRGKVLYIRLYSFLLQIWSVLSHNSGSANAHAPLDGLWRQRPRRIVETTGNADTVHASLQARARLPANYSTPYAAAPVQSEPHDLVDGAGGCRIVSTRSLPEHPAKGRQAFRHCGVVVC
jgi:hypothetical protein